MLIQSDFANHQPIPVKYTCEGENLSPPLQFISIPSNAKSLVLLVDDPDAPHGTFDHWVVWNIPPHVTSLSEGARGLFNQGSQVQQGRNGFGKLIYQGPCPPKGHPHHYYFKLYALNTMLDLGEEATKRDVEKAMQGHILDQAQLVGTYKRQ